MSHDPRPYEVTICGNVRASSTSSSRSLAIFALAITVLVSVGVVLMQAIGSGQ